MENINWICKSKTVNNNIVWMCNSKKTLQTHEGVDSRFREHFESTTSVALLGTTSFSAGPVNITLGPANFGPSSSLCDDTTGYYKMAEYIFQPDWKHPSYNTDTFKGLNGKMYCDGPEYTGEWNGLYFCGTGIGPWFLGFCAVDNNGTNFMSAIQDFAKYQEFSAAFSVIIRDKSTPTNYYLFPRVAFDCNPLVPHCRIYNTTTESQAIAQYRMGYSALPDVADFPSETSFNGQSGGTPPPKGSGGVLYEVFVKPFTRPTFPFKAEPKKSTFTPLPDDLQAQTILWYDAADPNGDGSEIPDDTPLKKWVDKSPNKLNLVRAPVCPHDDSKLNLDMNDGEYTANRGDFDAQGNIVHKWKNRLPRLKANFKNGLSVIRFNGNNGFSRPHASGPCVDPNWNKFYASGIGQIKDQASLTGHSIFIVHYQTEYGPHDGCLFSVADCRIGTSQHVPVLYGYNRGGQDAASYIVDNYYILNKWVISSVVKFKSSNKPSHKIFANGTQVNQNWNVGNHNNYDPTSRPDIWDFGFIRRWDNGTSIGCGGTNPNAASGFTGDIAEVICFPVELSDADRVRVETYLAKKWNLSSEMNIPLPTDDPKAGFSISTPTTIFGTTDNAVQLFTNPSFTPPEPVVSSFCVGYSNARNGQPFRMSYSPDGLTNWQVSPSTSLFGTQVFSAVYNGKMWIAGTCCGSPNSVSGMLSSTDGINWTPIKSDGLAYSIPTEYSCRKICWGNNRWVAWLEGMIYASTDGIKFRRGRNSPNLNCISYANGLFLGGANAQIFKSVDGIKWKPTGVLEGRHASYSQTSDMVFFNNMWIAGYAFTGNQGADNIIYTSTDLKTWSIQPSATELLAIQTYGSGVYCLCTNGKVVVAGLANINKHCILYSTDGTNWKKTDVEFFGCTIASSITWNGKYFIATIWLQQAFRPDENFFNVYSADGISWKNSPEATKFNPAGFVFIASQNILPYNPLPPDNNFPVGSYTSEKLKTIGPSTVQSIKVPSGLEAVLYQNNNMTGNAISITSNAPDLSKLTDTLNSSFNWNKQMQSMVVRNYVPIKVGSTVSLITDKPIGILFPSSAGTVVQITGSNAQVADYNNPGLLYWYNLSDLQVIATPSLAPALAPAFSPALLSPAPSS